MSTDQLRAIMAAIIYSGIVVARVITPEGAVQKADEILSAVRLQRPTA